MKYQRALALLTVVLFSIGVAAAEVIDFRTVGGKTVICMHTGLFSPLHDCSVRADWYSYSFVGLIARITPIENNEEEIQITPEEIFHGEPGTPLTVRTSQALCLPKLAVGDRWLFFLRKEKDKPIILDYYGNDSRPVADAQPEIETLRRLKTIGDSAIVRGRVLKGMLNDGKPFPGARVIAHRVTDNLEFSTDAGADGHYEFPPLPPGRYTLTVSPIGPFQPDVTTVFTRPGACWDVPLWRRPHALIGGHVHRPDGSPAAQVPVMIVSADGSSFASGVSDASGYFQFDSMQSGKYVVGINLPGAPAWKFDIGAGKGVAPPASLYYPGTRSRSGASVIDLLTDQKRDDIDFIVPKP